MVKDVTFQQVVLADALRDYVTPTPYLVSALTPLFNTKGILLLRIAQRDPCCFVHAVLSRSHSFSRNRNVTLVYDRRYI